jgi:hypothetical protein
MGKKIIIGLIITTILSLTAFGTVYAYQKDKSYQEYNSAQEEVVLSQNEEEPEKNFYGYTFQNTDICPKNKERVRNNFRFREQNSPECEYDGGHENQYQHRYENDCSSIKQGTCEEEKQFKNKNSNDHYRNGKR